MTLRLATLVNATAKGRKLKRRRPRKMRAIKPSRADEMAYLADLRALVRRLRESVESSLAGMRGMWPTVGDAAPGMGSVIREAKTKFGPLQKTADRMAKAAASRVRKTVDRKLVDEIRRSVSVDLTAVMIETPAIRRVMEVATRENVALIKSIPEQYFEKIERGVAKAWEGGARWESVVEGVKRIGDVTDTRARVIARDQISKMNASLNQERQSSVGITSYEWSTSNDERVRDSHKELEGLIFQWDSPPEVDGENVHPGEAILCRCTAIPAIDLDAIEAEALAIIAQQEAA